MKPAVNRWMAALGRLGFAGRALVLSIAMLLSLGVVAPVAYGRFGGEGFIVATLGMAICLISGMTAMVVCDRFRAPSQLLHNVLLGMMFRLMLPMACVIAVGITQNFLRDAGFVFYMLVFYPVMLLAETILAVQSFNSNLKKSNGIS